MAFWQLYAVYSSLLRNVDPFDQPQVEGSKKISFDKRLQYKGLL
jgi:glucose-6-phosphate isomerase